MFKPLCIQNTESIDLLRAVETAYVKVAVIFALIESPFGRMESKATDGFPEAIRTESIRELESWSES